MSSGELATRRTRRARDEVEAIAVTALRERWGDVHGRSELDDLAAAVAAGETDPYAAADELLGRLTPTEPGGSRSGLAAAAVSSLESIPMSLSFDPIDEAARQWERRWSAVPAMHAVTSLMRVQQLVLARLDGLLKELRAELRPLRGAGAARVLLAGLAAPGEDGERLQVHPTSVTSIVQRLEAAGLVLKRPDATDGRVVLAEITDAGRAAGRAGDDGAGQRRLRPR